MKCLFYIEIVFTNINNKNKMLFHNQSYIQKNTKQVHHQYNKFIPNVPILSPHQNHQKQTNSNSNLNTNSKSPDKSTQLLSLRPQSKLKTTVSTSFNIRKTTSINQSKIQLLQNFNNTKRSNNNNAMTRNNNNPIKDNNKILLYPQTMPIVSSTAWILHDTRNKKTYGLKSTSQRQIASLTKIMTCIIAIQMINKYKIDCGIMVRVTKSSAAVSGTTAGLIYGYWIKLIDLLHGLMLPSGNDAAYLIAESFGLLGFYARLNSQKQKAFQQIQSIDLTCYESTNHFVMHFIKLMNKKCRDLSLFGTSFTNPHGLSTSTPNLSTPKDLMNLTLFCHQNPLFSSLVSTKSFRTFLFEDQYDQQGFEIYWKNTNKLLQQGWEGTKTGQTWSAGCCLSSYRQGIVIVVLNSNDQETRFQDTVSIWEWYKCERMKDESGLINLNNDSKRVRDYL